MNYLRPSIKGLEPKWTTVTRESHKIRRGRNPIKGLEGLHCPPSAQKGDFRQNRHELA
jgi:hypothetical protein